MRTFLALVAVAAGLVAALEVRMPALAQDAKPADPPAFDLEAPAADKLKTATFALG